MSLDGPHLYFTPTQDSLFVELLMHKLKDAGYQTWSDTHKLVGGDSWRVEIDQAIKASLALVVVMSPEAKASEYVTYEWAFAWGRVSRLSQSYSKRRPSIRDSKTCNIFPSPTLSLGISYWRPSQRWLLDKDATQSRFLVMRRRMCGRQSQRLMHRHQVRGPGQWIH